MTDRPLLFRPEMVCALLDGRKTQTRRPAWRKPCVRTAASRIMVGDRVWVKENWRVGPGYDHWPPRDVPAIATVWYEATGEPSAVLGTPIGFAGKLRPSIHMPRRVSRLTLVVTDVRAERLQDISREDCIAEGMEGLADVWAGWHQSYAALYERIHGKGAWAANPEVVVITFTVHKGNIDALKVSQAA